MTGTVSLPLFGYPVRRDVAIGIMATGVVIATALLVVAILAKTQTGSLRHMSSAGVKSLFVASIVVGVITAVNMKKARETESSRAAAILVAAEEARIAAHAATQAAAAAAQATVRAAALKTEEEAALWGGWRNMFCSRPGPAYFPFHYRGTEFFLVKRSGMPDSHRLGQPYYSEGEQVPFRWGERFTLETSLTEGSRRFDCYPHSTDAAFENYASRATRTEDCPTRAEAWPYLPWLREGEIFYTSRGREDHDRGYDHTWFRNRVEGTPLSAFTRTDNGINEMRSSRTTVEHSDGKREVTLAELKARSEAGFAGSIFEALTSVPRT